MLHIQLGSCLVYCQQPSRECITGPMLGMGSFMAAGLRNRSFTHPCVLSAHKEKVLCILMHLFCVSCAGWCLWRPAQCLTGFDFVLQNTRGWQQELEPHSAGLGQGTVAWHRASRARDSRSHGAPVEPDAELFATSGSSPWLSVPVIYIVIL